MEVIYSYQLYVYLGDGLEDSDKADCALNDCGIQKTDCFPSLGHYLWFPQADPEKFRYNYLKVVYIEHSYDKTNVYAVPVISERGEIRDILKKLISDNKINSRKGDCL